MPLLRIIPNKIENSLFLLARDKTMLPIRHHNMKFWQLGSISSRVIMIAVGTSMLVIRPIGDDNTNKEKKTRDNKLSPQDPSIQ